MKYIIKISELKKQYFQVQDEESRRRLGRLTTTFKEARWIVVNDEGELVIPDISWSRVQEAIEYVIERIAAVEGIKQVVVETQK